MPRNHARTKRVGQEQHKKNDVGLAAPAHRPVKPKAVDSILRQDVNPNATSTHLEATDPRNLLHRRLNRTNDPRPEPAESAVRAEVNGIPTRFPGSPTVTDLNEAELTHELSAPSPKITTFYAGVEKDGLLVAPADDGVENSRIGKIDDSNRSESILSASPARDTIALLIMLFAIPSVLLMPVQFLFTILPFISSFGSELSWRQDPSFGPSGAPAVSTILIADMLLAFLSMCLSTSLRDFLSDLAHAVIAVSLGRDTTKPEISNTHLGLCISTVALIRALKLANVSELGYQDDFKLDPSAATTWFHRFERLTSLHLVAQAVLKWARESLIRQRHNAVAHRASAQNVSSILESTSAKSRDKTKSQPQYASPYELLNKSSRKHVPEEKVQTDEKSHRLSQPFWGAAANTRLQLIRGQREATIEHTARNGAFNHVASQRDGLVPWTVCVTEVLPDALSFLMKAEPGQIKQPANVNDRAIFARFPGTLKVNGETWHQLRVKPVEYGRNAADFNLRFWQGWINGLTPDQEYELNFVDPEAVVPTAVLHIATPLSDVPLDPNLQRASITELSPPDSPDNTLFAAEAANNEHKALLKRARKEQKAQLANMRKEMEVLKSKIASHDTQEEKQQRKILQGNQQNKQHEEAILELQSQVDALTKSRQSKSKSWEDTKAKWEKAKARRDNLKLEADSFMGEINDNHAKMVTEHEGLLKTVERLKARKERYAATAEKDKPSKKDKKRSSVEVTQPTPEPELTPKTNNEAEAAALLATLELLRTQTAEADTATATAVVELSTLETQQRPSTSPMGSNGFHSPLTPEGDIPGTVPRKFSADHGTALFARYQGQHGDGSRWPAYVPVTGVNGGKAVNGHGRAKSGSLGSSVGSVEHEGKRY